MNLNFSNKQLTELPIVTTEQKQTCTILNLSNNKLTSLKDYIGQFKNLQQLNISNNLLTELPTEIGELKRLGILRANNNKLSQVPVQIINLSNLKILELHNNQLTSIPRQISELKQLQNLNLANNKLETINIEFSETMNLMELYFNDNALNSLPASIGKLIKLRKLHLSNNQLKQIPKEIGKAKNIQQLELQGNDLKELQNELFDLPILSKLNISDNKIEIIPESITKLQNLRELDLSYNKLSFLPKGMQKFRSLSHLVIIGNYLPMPDDDKNTQSLIQYVLKYQSRRTSNVFKTQKVYIFQNLSLPQLMKSYTACLNRAFSQWDINYIDIKSESDINNNTTVVFIILTWDTHRNSDVLEKIINKCKKLEKEFYIFLQPDKYVTLDLANKEKIQIIQNTHQWVKQNYSDRIIEYETVEELPSTIKQLIQKHTPKIEIKKLSLKNIGHFSDLDIEFPDNVTCLVGENGTGKTTILRAIALGLIGPKNDRIIDNSIEKLLRVKGFDNEKQSIIIEKAKITVFYTIDGDEFSNEIDFTYNKNTKEFRITTNKMSEVIVNDVNLKMLILGFPQIRSEANIDKRYIPKNFKHPHVNDLIPLINNLDDERLKSFIDWIINLDSAAKSNELKLEAHKKKTIVKEREIIRSTFEIISEISDHKVEFLDVTQLKPPLVWVRTNDAPDGISMDMLAQGYKEIIGWIGYFIQRMVEAYPYSADFRKKPAIVFVDEIDAFCHPRWQRKILNVLQKTFPKVQFIVTSHSPLIALDRDINEIKELYIENNEVKVRSNANDTKNTDLQTNVLTYFDLDSVLSPSLQKDVDRYFELKTKKEINTKEFKDLENRINKAQIGLPIYDYKYLLFLDFLRKHNIDPYQQVEKVEMTDEQFKEFEEEYKKYV